MRLNEAQGVFAGALLPRLLVRAHETFDRVTLGECWRPPQMVEIYVEAGTGSPTTLHADRLAIDLNLFRRDARGRLRYLTSNASHRPLGEWWEVLPDRLRARGVEIPLAIETAWGGRFGDGNHYSVRWRGRA